MAVTFCYPVQQNLVQIDGTGRKNSNMSVIRASKIDNIWKRIVEVRLNSLISRNRSRNQIAETGIRKVEQFATLVPVVEKQVGENVEAERKHTLLNPGFSFSAAGLLFPYHLGVSQCLIERKYITEDTPLAGSSAGAIVCTVVAAGMSMPEAMLATKEVADDCRKNGTAFRLGSVLRRVLNEVVPDDAHIKASGRVRVAMTQVFRSPQRLLVDQFDSKEDLIDALIASSYIPGYLGPRPVTVFKNRICIDGAFTFFMPPTAAETTVRVCVFPPKPLGLEKDVDISPGCNPGDRASIQELFKWALAPAEDSVLDELYEDGYKDALAWVECNPISNFRKN